jgi:hypothetical protein
MRHEQKKQGGKRRGGERREEGRGKREGVRGGLAT